MTRFNISLHHITLAAGDALPPLSDVHQAVWLKTGSVEVAGIAASQGEGISVRDAEIIATAPTDLLVFRISSDPAEPAAALTAPFDWDGPAILRLDQVNFPRGARAYRHVHPGPGIRSLTKGELEIKSDHDCTLMQAGDAWFEDANSPVQATAGDVPTAFVRAMILPMEYFGKPTLRLLNPDDHEKPRLQSNTRFFDQTIDLSGT